MTSNHEAGEAFRAEVKRMGLFSALTPEQQAAALDYAGPVASGRSGLPRAPSWDEEVARLAELEKASAKKPRQSLWWDTYMKITYGGLALGVSPVIIFVGVELYRFIFS